MNNLVILPVRVGLEMTKNCVKSIRNQDIPITLLCIDNGTTDGCGPWLRSTGEQMITYPRAIGLSRLWNNALGMAFDYLKLPYCWVVNNDTEFLPSTYRKLIEDGGQFVTGIGVSDRKQMTEGEYRKSPHPDFSSFCIRREVWREIGGFDDSMVIYCSDNDYHVRMHQAGIDAHCIGVPFYHVASGTIKHADNATRDAIQQQADQDRETFRKKWGCSPGTPEYEKLFTTQP